jgi:hypothetical protein
MPWVNPSNPATGDLITATQAVIVATDLNIIGGPWTSYSPTLIATTTNPTLGTGPTQSGGYIQIGKTIVGFAKITLGTGPTAGSGTYSITIPVNAARQYDIVGAMFIFDQSGNATWCGAARINAGLNGVNLLFTAATNYIVTNSSPFTPAASDQFLVNFQYETL